MTGQNLMMNTGSFTYKIYKFIVRKRAVISSEIAEEFKERWSDIYTSKEVYCFDIPEDADFKEQKKQLRKKLLPHINKLIDDMMGELVFDNGK